MFLENSCSLQILRRHHFQYHILHSTFTMPTAFIIGAGPNVGQAVAETFAAAGFQVAVASRTPKLDAKFRHYVFDGSKPETLPAVFEKVSADLGVPSVVIYNAYKGKVETADNPFGDIDLDTFKENLGINTLSPFVAVQEAIKGFEKLGPSGLGPAGGTFIFTGNITNVSAIPGFLVFGMQKSATASMIQNLALASYPDKPYKFYFTDERRSDGTYVPQGLSGPAHAAIYIDLAKDAKQRPWNQTFVYGKGYVEFPRKEFLPWNPN
ncbi:NAD(P)-binding protein [Jackrogersella minutella]|nr:NAD(P)-binding protein [Jackrogersella minutella]